MLVHKDEDVKSDASANKEKESISTIVSIFRSINCSEDMVDAAKSKVVKKNFLSLSLLLIFCIIIGWLNKR